MKILFVCTGNTCRSPLAQAVCELEGQAAGLNLDCESAGLSVCEGEEMSEYSVEAVKALYGKTVSHRAHPVTAEMVEKSDLVVGMTRTHQYLLQQALPAAKEKIRTLPEEIPDPYGNPREVYLRTALAIQKGIRQWIAEGVLHD